MSGSEEIIFYRRWLPHYRAPGSTYHSRFSIENRHMAFTEAWQFEVVEASILLHHKRDCLIYAYVVMANHAHVILQPLPYFNTLEAWTDPFAFHRLECITGRMKGRSSRLINQRKRRRGTLWKNESFDRIIRNKRDLDEVIDYIHHNPVRWNLVKFPEQYRWSSAHTIYSGGERYRGWLDLPPIGTGFGW